ncbi:unnamed protein product [Urochloa humidicola]
MGSAHLRHFADPHALLKMQYNSTATHICDICRSKLAGLIGYRCSACDFDIHEACADYFKESISFFAHPWHTLTLTRMPKSCVGWICDLCREECPPGNFVYRCVRCMFDVHPLCTMLPQTIRSLLHKAHDLCMTPATTGHCCSACNKGLAVWQYRCGFCGLKLHIACASGVEQDGAAASATQTTGAAANAAQTTPAAATATQTTGAAQSENVARRSRRSTAVAKFLLKTCFRQVIHTATGGLASPMFETLEATWN